MAVHLRTARRATPGWLPPLIILTLAALGGTVLWSNLQYSTSHTGVQGGQADNQGREVVLGSESQEEAEQGPASAEGDEGLAAHTAAAQAGGGAHTSNTQANLDAWTQLTSLPKSADGSSTTVSWSGNEDTGGDAAAAAGTEQQQGEQQQPAGQQAGGKAAAGGGSGGKGGAAQPDASSSGGYVTVDLRVPKAPPTYNSWVLAEDMLLFHLRALQQQLEQTYIAMAVAAAAGRGFILPEFSCFCQSSSEPLPRCRRPDSGDLQFPYTCPEADVLMAREQFAVGPGERGMPLDVRPAGYAKQVVPATGEGKLLVLQPSATILWPACADAPDTCTRESRQGRATILAVPPSLISSSLLPFLEPYRDFPLWKLDLSDVGSHWHAFAGWPCAEPAQQFDLRMSKAAKPWCCQVAPDGSMPGGLARLNMTTGRLYSTVPGLQNAC